MSLFPSSLMTLLFPHLAGLRIGDGDQANIVRQGDKVLRVESAPYALADRQGYDLVIDGVFGSATWSVVANFQTAPTSPQARKPYLSPSRP